MMSADDEWVNETWKGLERQRDARWKLITKRMQGFMFALLIATYLAGVTGGFTLCLFIIR